MKIKLNKKNNGNGLIIIAAGGFFVVAIGVLVVVYVLSIPQRPKQPIRATNMVHEIPFRHTPVPHDFKPIGPNSSQ
jgi:cell division septal protein FtsQ